MKLLLRLLIAGVLLTSARVAPAQVVLFLESFESAGPAYDSGQVTTTPPFLDSTSDYWQRVQDSNISLNGGNTYSGEAGTFYWAFEDTDDNGGNGNNEQVMDLIGINISGYTNLQFSGLFAADGQNGSNFTFDSTDHLHVLYRVDGGAFQNGLWFESNQPTGNNDPILQDTNFNGVGDGTQLNATFSLFSFNIPVTGTTLDIRILAEADGGNEEMAFDLLTVTGAAVPEPSSALLLILSAFLALRRRR